MNDMNLTALRRTKWFRGIYHAGIGIKGIDGTLELLAGLALLFVPTALHDMFATIVGRASEHNGRAAHFIAEYVARLDHDLASSGLTFLIIFLIGHGVVKLILVYCLFHRIVWAYPYALFVLGLFLAYQLYVVVQDPKSIGLWLITALDLFIIWLVFGEWRDLSSSSRRSVRKNR